MPWQVHLNVCWLAAMPRYCLPQRPGKILEHPGRGGASSADDFPLYYYKRGALAEFQIPELYKNVYSQHCMRPSLVRNEGGLVTAWTALGKRLVRNEVGLGHSLDNGRTAIGQDGT